MSSTSSFRGGYAPRGGRGGWARPSVNPKKQYVKPDIEKYPLGQLLKNFEKSQIGRADEKIVASNPISDVRYVTSYNWRSDGSTTIMVPGKPPRWAPPATAQRLKEDSGQYYRDPNAARFPEYPIAPVFRAILYKEPGFHTGGVDVVACGSTLGNLLRFVRGQDKAFRFTVETVASSVLFLRKENDPKELIPGVRGFGHSFPEAYTMWENEVKGSETHQRIIQYKFGGLSCLLRFECDGYLKENIASSASNNKVQGNQNHEDDNLLGALETAAITLPTASSYPESDRLQVEGGGAEIPQATVFDLKTRSGKYKADIDMSDIYPQLWIKQVPNFIVAYHDGVGLFKDIGVQDIREKVRDWEKENLDSIRRLAALSEEIVTFAREDGGLLEVYCSGGSRLELHRQFGEGKNGLPSELALEWAKESEAGLEFSSSNDGNGLTFGEDRDGDLEDDWNANSDDDEPDYTACSAEDCGYCGKCTY